MGKVIQMTTAHRVKASIDSKTRCQCGCGKETRGGRFLPGHNMRKPAKVDEKSYFRP